MITIKNLCVVFNEHTAIEKTALKNINLTIKESDFVTVIGGNGAGKSTLMNTLAGETRQSQGEILVENEDVSHLTTEKRARYVSRVFQDPLTGCFANMTVAENLALAYGINQQLSFKLALTKQKQCLLKDKLVALGVGLEKRLQDKMGLLSGGQRQAVSLMMATVRPSKILLLDEHTAALDPKMADTVMQITERLIKEYALTTLMVTHSMVQALQFGNRMLVMQEGQIVQDLSCERKKLLKPVDLIHYFK